MREILIVPAADIFILVLGPTGFGFISKQTNYVDEARFQSEIGALTEFVELGSVLAFSRLAVGVDVVPRAPGGIARGWSEVGVDGLHVPGVHGAQVLQLPDGRYELPHEGIVRQMLAAVDQVRVLVEALPVQNDLALTPKKLSE